MALKAPLVAFASFNKSVPSHVVLNITEQLMMKAAEMATDSLPSVFSLISVVESEEQITLALQREAPAFAFPEPVLSPRHLQTLETPVVDVETRPVTTKTEADVPKAESKRKT